MTNDKVWMMISVGSCRSGERCRFLIRRSFSKWTSTAAISVSASFNVVSSVVLVGEAAVD